MESTSEPVTLRPRLLELLVYAGQDVRAYPLPTTGHVTIGRSSSSDIRVDHRSVSREHLVVHLDDGIEVEDLGSSNGTMLFRTSRWPSQSTVLGQERTEPGGVTIPPRTRTRVGAGEMVRIGSILLVFQVRKHSETLGGKPDATARGGGPKVLLDEEMQRIYRLATRTAATDISVLILGETGVGKEVLAETIHFRSARASRAFLRLNCAALSESLLESELFGYERGAFTGAHQTRIGLLEASDGGTVLLDEIGELPNAIQVKLLRVLEERVVRRIGSNRPRAIDVRFITATNRDLGRAVSAGLFRRDLYFRINGVQLLIPPLRDRRCEIVPLAEHFLHDFCERSGLAAPRISDEATSRLLEYSWPGNVRELRNVMERAPFLCTEGVVGAEHVPTESEPVEPLFGDEDEFDVPTEVLEPPRGTSLEPSERERDTSERDRITRALEACGGNQTRAAKLLGMSRRTLVNRLDAYGLPRPRKS
ncbi:MAG: sigma 54-interacting transcriptional regulator [Polyangiaceae bacterium]|nr:sigma 54-interacting transcriptional regulator [Polyangiaceae bacterium]